MLWGSLQALFRSSCGDPEVMPYDIKWSQFDATYEYCKSAVVFFCFQVPLSQHIQTHLHHTVEVVLNAWNNQTLHISPWRFQNHQALFLKPCLQHRWAQQCADTIISYSKPWTTAIFSHPDRGRGGEERGGEQSKGSLGSLYHLSPSKGGVPNFQMMGSFVVGSEVRCRDDGPAGPCLTVSL